jgi:hypothetical protein
MKLLTLTWGVFVKSPARGRVERALCIQISRGVHGKWRNMPLAGGLVQAAILEQRKRER